LQRQEYVKVEQKPSRLHYNAKAIITEPGVNCDHLPADAAPERLELSGLHSEFESASASCSASSDARFRRPKSSSNALPIKHNRQSKLATRLYVLLHQLYIYQTHTCKWVDS